MRMLGVDFGARRIGLAVSDASGTLARPWKTIEQKNQEDAGEGRVLVRVIEEVRSLAAEADGLSAIVVGLPLRLDGTPTELTHRVQAFADDLRRATKLPVELQDERLSSREAQERLALRERDWRRRRQKLDAASAAVILQDYLDTRPH